MNENVRRQPPPKLPKVCLPDPEHVLRLTSDEYDVLGDMLQYLWEPDQEALLEFANDYRKQLYGDDWTPDLGLTMKKFDKVMESLSNKHFAAGFYGSRDQN